MSYIHPAWVEHQRKRWLKPDWQRWMRHDAYRFAPPEPRTNSYAARIVEERRNEEKQAAIAAEQNALRADLEHLRWLVKDLKIDLAIQRLRRKYSPDQPRDQRGRWTNSGQTTLANPEVENSADTDGSEDEQSLEESVILASGRPKGHHFVNQSLYRDLPLPPETRKVFDQATTGSLSPDVHRWSKEHADYNKAVKESFDKLWRLGEFVLTQ